MLVIGQPGHHLQELLIKRYPETKHISGPDIRKGIGAFSESDKRRGFVKSELRHAYAFPRRVRHVGNLHGNRNLSDIIDIGLDIIKMSIDFIQAGNGNKA